jgi:hypothetical protein
MAHFVKLGRGNVVEQVIVISNDVATTEQDGVDFINNLYKTNDLWKQTSYNTRGGVHILDGVPFRKNYASIGDRYDEERDAFIPKKKFNSWILDEDTCTWKAPIDKPDDGKLYIWDENNINWKERVFE